MQTMTHQYTTPMKAMQLSSGMAVVLDGRPQVVRRVGYNAESKILDVETWEGQKYLLPPESDLMYYNPTPLGE